MPDAEYTALLEGDLRDSREYIRQADKLVETMTAELARLRAIESAARDFQRLANRHQSMLLPACRRYLAETLFALLDAAPTQ